MSSHFDDDGSEGYFPTYLVQLACQLDGEWNIMFLSLFIEASGGDDDDDWSVSMSVR